MPITLKDFWEEGAKPLSLQLITGEKYLGKKVGETAVNRPGLALTGFFQYFAQRRLQIFGLAEFTYLKSLPEAEVRQRLEELFQQNIPGVVLTRNRRPSAEMIKLAEKYKVPVFRTSMITMRFVNECTLLL